MTAQRLSACSILPAVLVAVLGCAPTLSERMPVALVRRTTPLDAGPVVVASAQDLRPEALKSHHEPVRSWLFSAYWLIGGHYKSTYEGPMVYGDGNLHLTTSTGPGRELAPMEGLNTYLPVVLGAGIGREVAAVSAGPEAMKDPARLLAGGSGLAILPVVDQMDVCRLSSESSHQDVSIDFQIERREAWDMPRGNVVAFPAMPAGTYGPRYAISTTSSGTSEESTQNTGLIGNVRVRLLLFRIEGGRVVERATIYAAGAGDGLSAALAVAGSRMAVGVGEFLGRSGH
jgi:hypothetical protein